jgi:hypothetical protein
MNRVVVIVALILLVALCVSQAQADRLILAPKGSLLDKGGVKAEIAFRSSDGDSILTPSNADQIDWLALGLGRVEIEGRRLVRSDGMDKDTVGLELSILPQTMLTPAVGVGVRDITHELETSYYLAVSMAVPATHTALLPIHDIKVHGGFGINGEFNGLFLGAEAQFPLKITLAAETVDSKLNASFAWNGIPKVALKAYMLDGEFFYGADARIKL